ncbi:Uncharacterized NAD(P)/FAD-binding protein YdhS [Filimonas lacunae]|uniref:Uncharacterized NAD(P)/FAD-binding protein YdhS n=1 Tax=Filimonas lacunae TaxID=477680 RepID=A0A173MRQ0_9BACT|nr:FAD/NAD(P)-binding protein [Filimonas lacunae]BAV10061.1 hypothetical protein FLA_6116 [Filimonas lacunae]SIS83392.1 Uncharacterized NAD(P)/FAD-binding protein YdhS [Filimonas lacunae]
MSTPVIVIIGGGFCGMMTAVHLCRKAQTPLHIKIIHTGHPFAKGVAYSTYSKEHLLNVRTKGMSAFANTPDHFVQWLLQQPDYSNIDATLLGNAFVPRIVYGNYLQHIWEQTLFNKPEHINVEIITDTAIDIVHCVKGYHVICENSEPIIADSIVLATGNGQPRLPGGIAAQHNNNPWAQESVQNVSGYTDILIVGNGLTMADTVLGLRENGFTGVIHTISPHGYALRPHVAPHSTYTLPEEEVNASHTLQHWKRLIYKEVSLAAKTSLPQEVVIDALRPYTCKAWQQLTLADKQLFIKQLGHRWNVLRHRLPAPIHQILAQEQQQGKLVTHAGIITQTSQQHPNTTIQVYWQNRSGQTQATLAVQKIINCTGPDNNATANSNPLLHTLYQKGVIVADPLQLGILVNKANFSIIDADDFNHKRVVTLGNNLKGLLWESTAIPELRNQTEQTSAYLLGILFKAQKKPVYK